VIHDHQFLDNINKRLNNSANMTSTFYIKQPSLMQIFQVRESSLSPAFFCK